VTAEELHKQAEALGTRLLQALASQSVDACMLLMPPLEEYRLVMDQPRLTERKYRRQLKKQVTNFFNKYDRYFTEHRDWLAETRIEHVRVTEFDEMMRSHNMFKRADTVAEVFYRTAERTLDDGDISVLNIKVEFAVSMKSQLWIHNFLTVETSQSFDKATKTVGPLGELGFQVLDKSDYAAALTGQPPLVKRLMDNYNQTMYADGDVHVTSDQVELLKHNSALIAGDLIVDGVLATEDINQLFVLGDVQAKSILLDEAFCVFAGETRFEDALIVMYDTSVTVRSARGPLFYNLSEAADVEFVDGAVQVCFDWETNRVFGDPSSLLDAKFIGSDSGEPFLNIGPLWDALLAGKGMR